MKREQRERETRRAQGNCRQTATSPAKKKRRLENQVLVPRREKKIEPEALTATRNRKSSTLSSNFLTFLSKPQTSSLSPTPRASHFLIMAFALKARVMGANTTRARRSVSLRNRIAEGLGGERGGIEKHTLFLFCRLPSSNNDPMRRRVTPRLLSSSLSSRAEREQRHSCTRNGKRTGRERKERRARRRK